MRVAAEGDWIRPQQASCSAQRGHKTAKFMLKKGSTGRFRFNLVATIESYGSRASAINGIESVKRNARC